MLRSVFIIFSSKREDIYILGNTTRHPDKGISFVHDYPKINAVSNDILILLPSGAEGEK